MTFITKDFFVENVFLLYKLEGNQININFKLNRHTRMSPVQLICQPVVHLSRSGQLTPGLWALPTHLAISSCYLQYDVSLHLFKWHTNCCLSRDSNRPFQYSPHGSKWANSICYELLSYKIDSGNIFFKLYFLMNLNQKVIAEYEPPFSIVYINIFNSYQGKFKLCSLIVPNINDNYVTKFMDYTLYIHIYNCVTNYTIIHTNYVKYNKIGNLNYK